MIPCVGHSRNYWLFFGSNDVRDICDFLGALALFVYL